MKLEHILENQFIDQRNGLGWVPNNQEVDYLGLRVKMKPSVFLQLARSISTPRDGLSHITQHLRDGGTVGSPFLHVHIPTGWDEEIFTQRDSRGDDIVSPEIARVSGHEGRHRMMAIKQVFGDIPVEVHIFAQPYKNRHFQENPDWVRKMSKELLAQDTGVLVRNPFKV